MASNIIGNGNKVEIKGCFKDSIGLARVCGS
jgi:hypothetical protein